MDWGSSKKHKRGGEGINWEVGGKWRGGVNDDKLAKQAIIYYDEEEFVGYQIKSVFQFML